MQRMNRRYYYRVLFNIDYNYIHKKHTAKIDIFNYEAEEKNSGRKSC